MLRKPEWAPYRVDIQFTSETNKGPGQKQRRPGALPIKSGQVHNAVLWWGLKVWEPTVSPTHPHPDSWSTPECLLLRALQAQPQWGWDCGSPSFQLHDCEVNPARWMCCGTVILPRDQGITHAPILPLMNIVWFYTVFFFPPIPNYLRGRYDQRQFPYHDSFHTCLQSLGSVTQSRSATWFIAWTITTSSKDLQQQQAKIRSLKQVWTQAPRYGTLWTPGIPTQDAMNPRHTNMERYEPQVYWHGKLWNPGILTWDAMNPRNIDMGSRHRNWQLHHQIKCLPLVHEFELQWIIGVTFIVVLVF